MAGTSEATGATEAAPSPEPPEPSETPDEALGVQTPEAVEVVTESSPETSGEGLLIVPASDIPTLPIPSAQGVEAMIPPPPPLSDKDLEATDIKDAAARVTEVTQAPADFMPAEAAEAVVVVEATAAAEAAVQAYAEEGPVCSGNHDG